MYEIYQGISHPGCIPAYPGYGYMIRDLYETITSSHLTLNTKQGRIKNFKLSGVTRQVETTGANLFGGKALTDKIMELVPTAVLDTANRTIKYVASAIVDKVLFTGFEAGKQYTIILYGKNSNETMSPSNLSVIYGDNTSADLLFADVGKDSYCVFTTRSDKTPVSLRGIYGSQTTTLYYDKCGIFEGTIALEAFEPYTGATSSPSPEYPQNIQGVGVRTAQMLDFTKVITYGWCALVDADTGTIKCDIVNDYYCVLKITYLNDYIMAHKGGNLTFYADQPLDTWLSIIIDGTRSSGKTYQEATGKGKIVKATIADDFTSVRFMELRLNRKSSAFTDTDTVIPNIMLCEGTAVLPYEPYGYRTDVVTRSKNLLDRQRMLDFILQKSGASIVQFDGRRCLKLDGGFNFPDFNLYEDFEPEKRYTLTYDGFYEKYKTEAFLSNGFAFTLQNGGRNLSLMDVSDIGTWKHKTTTSDTGVSKLTFTYGVSSVVYIDLDTIQLEEGTISTPYQPYAYYTAPIYTREPLTQWDHLEYRNGKYGVVKKSAVVVEDGTRPTINTYWPSVVFKTLDKTAVARGNVYCNYCTLGHVKTASAYGTAMEMYKCDTYWGFSDADAVQAWLVQKNAEGKPLYYCYETVEESWEPLPAISQQALRNLPTYKGATMIGTTDPLEPEITVSYIPAKKNFFNPEKVFSNPVPGATRYFKYDLGLSPGSYRWNLQKNEFLGSGQHVLFTDDLKYEGAGVVSGKIYDWIGHSTSELYCHTSGSFVVRDEMYIAVYNGNVDAVKPLLKTLRIEKA